MTAPDQIPSRRRLMVHGLTPSRRGEAVTQAAPVQTSSASHPMFLVGHGYDIHRVQPGGTLVLGGVAISNEISPIAHSDGDVVLHAITDAIFGALGMGDIGQHFPDNDPQLRGAQSRRFVDAAYAMARSYGYRLSNVDVTLLLERPKISPHRAAMLESMRSLFEPAAIVNLKACTNEGLDAIGRGEAMAAHATVLLISDR